MLGRLDDHPGHPPGQSADELASGAPFWPGPPTCSCLVLGLYALPVFLTLMFIVATQDAVDLVFGTTVAGRPGDGLFRPQ